MKLCLAFVVVFSVSATFSARVPGPRPNGKCNSLTDDYAEVLRLSNLFYEAQRSGKLPADNRVPWRGDSAVNDGSDVGVDLEGGYYDAGDDVKFGFPAAQAMTTLAWGGVAYKAGYQSAGEWENLLAAVKWGTDYFIKCHTSDTEFYGQVGDGNADHGWWGRPEDMTMYRPSFKVTSSQPGSDLAGETAAAFAAASILFKDDDADYSATLLDHAKRLYDFADKYRGKYSDVISNAAGFYNSWNGYNDELVWGAAWLYKATEDSTYLSKAESYYSQFGLEELTGVFSWDDKAVGCSALLAELTGKSTYVNALKAHCDDATTRQTSSGGEVWWDYPWGSLRYAANSALICLQAADLVDGKSETYTKFAEDQMAYSLGGNGQSFVVGYGPNWPKQPHHRAASCPDMPAPCSWDQFNSPGPNPQVLNGALVGGPDSPDDQYNDRRSDYTENEVTLDYNAAFQSTIAGLQAKKCTIL